MTGYVFLFISAFGAATLLPSYSEVALVAMLTQDYNVGLLWFVASLGNTLGSAVNWLVGKYLIHFQHKSWFPFKEPTIKKSQRWFERYGKWSLLMAWLPIVGDALTLIAGMMKVRFMGFFILVAIGKGSRYLVLIIIYQYFKTT